MRTIVASPTHSHSHILAVYPVPTNEAMTTESQRYNCFIRNEGNAIPQQACAGAKGSNSTAGLTLLWACNPFRGNSNHWKIAQEEARRIIPKRRHGKEKESFMNLKKRNMRSNGVFIKIK